MLIYVYVATMEDMYLLMQPETQDDCENIQKPSLLLVLPGEIRNQIWRMLLTTNYAFNEPTSEGEQARYELAPALLRVNRQVHQETYHILREENMWITVCITMPRTPIRYMSESRNFPVVSRNILTEPNVMKEYYLGMESHALNVFLSPKHVVRYPYCKFHTMIMGPESLPYLMQFLFAMGYTNRFVPSPPTKEIELYVGYPACFSRSKLQRELVEPFRAVRGFGKIFINGNVDEDLADSLYIQMRQPFRSDTEILEFSHAYLEKGDAAAAAGRTKAANFYYEHGSDFTFFAGQSYLDRQTPRRIHHVYQSPSIASMLTTFDIRWAKTLLKLRCYADVQRLVSSVLRRGLFSLATRDENIHLILYCALASLGLGETDRFTQIMLGLFQGSCDLGDFPAWNGSTPAFVIHETFPIPIKWSVIMGQMEILTSMDDIVAYCREGAEGSLRRVDTGGVLLDPDGIEFYVAREWSAVSTRYENRRRKWARNLSVAGML